MQARHRVSTPSSWHCRRPATQVEVNGAASSLLQTTDSQVTTTFSTEQLSNLPLNNGFDTVAEVVPGVVSTHGDSFSNTNGDNYSVNGQSGRYNNSQIDGQSNNDNGIGGPQVFFSNQDAIQEIQVISNNFSAQYGRNAGAIVNYITKSGTNSLHGSGFEYYQSQFLSSFENQQKSPAFGFCGPGQSPSSGCIAPSLARFAENRYGGTIGGPILKDKLFFFGSTFWDHVRVGASPRSTLPYLSPTPAGVQQLQSAFPGSPAISGPCQLWSLQRNSGQSGGESGSVGGLMSCAIAPSPMVLAWKQSPGPNGASVNVPFAGVQRSIPNLFNDEENLGRLDFQPTSRDHLFVRYFYQKQFETGEGGGENGRNRQRGLRQLLSTAHSVGADWTHTFS